MKRQLLLSFVCLFAVTQMSACGGADDSSADDDPNALKGGSGNDSGINAGPTGKEKVPEFLLGDGEVLDYEFQDNVDFIDDHPDVDSIVGSGENGLIMKPKAGKKLGFKKGRILLSRKKMFARKIKSVESKTGESKFDTETVKLTDIFKTLHVKGKADLYAPVKGSAKGSASKPGTQRGAITWVDSDNWENSEKTKTLHWQDMKKIYDTENLDVTLDGGFTLITTFELEVYIASGEDSKFRAEFGMEASSTIQAIIQAQAEVTKGDKYSFTLGKLPWAFGPIAGVVEFGVALEWEAELEAEGTLTYTTGFENFGFSVGAKWRQGDGWEKISDKSGPDWKNEIEVDATLEASLMVFPAIEADVLVYGVLGVSIGVGPKFEANLEAEANASSGGGKTSTFGKVCADIDVALVAYLDFVIDLWGFFEKEYDLGEFTIQSWPDIWEECWTYSSGTGPTPGGDDGKPGGKGDGKP